MTSRRRRTAVAVIAAAVGIGSLACSPERPELIAVDNGPAAVDATAVPDGGADAEPTAMTEARRSDRDRADGEDRAEPTVAPESSASPEPSATPEPTATPAGRPVAPNGQRAPIVATDPEGLAAQIVEAETTLRDPNASPDAVVAAGHLQQVAYRKLAREDDFDATLLPLIPVDLRPTVELHITARRSLRGLASGFPTADFIPAWEIVEPEPAENLLAYYREASADSGIEWEYLAAINLIETGMGRINGLSGAGAQGPMQFMPTTWDEVGEGDVFDPHDAIIAAARYLVRRGGPDDMPKALWGYNNSDEYVASVSTYAQILRDDPDAFLGLYHWQIYFWTDAGDVWLPSGYRSATTIDVDDYLGAAPWSEPDPGLG